MRPLLQSISKYIKWPSLLRDVAILLLLFYGVSAWQSRHLLALDSHLSLTQQNLVGLDGQTTSFIKNHKPTLIYFFAPWCQVCALSMGNLAYLDSDKVNIVSIAMDYSDSKEVQHFVDRHNLSIPVLLGHDGLKQQFKIQGYPTYYMVDKDHKVIGKAYGYSTALGLKLRQVFSG